MGGRIATCLRCGREWWFVGCGDHGRLSLAVAPRPPAVDSPVGQSSDVRPGRFAPARRLLDARTRQDRRFRENA